MHFGMFEHDDSDRCLADRNNKICIQKLVSAKDSGLALFRRPTSSSPSLEL